MPSDRNTAALSPPDPDRTPIQAVFREGFLTRFFGEDDARELQALGRHLQGYIELYPTKRPPEHAVLAAARDAERAHDDLHRVAELIKRQLGTGSAPQAEALDRALESFSDALTAIYPLLEMEAPISESPTETPAETKPDCRIERHSTKSVYGSMKAALAHMKGLMHASFAAAVVYTAVRILRDANQQLLPFVDDEVFAAEDPEPLRERFPCEALSGELELLQAEIFNKGKDLTALATDTRWPHLP